MFAAILGDAPPPIAHVNRDAPAELVADRREGAGEEPAPALSERRRHARGSAPAASRRFRARRGRAATPALHTVAVLPFTDLAGDASNDVWGIGMTDAIIGRLAPLQHLAVRPTTAVLKYVKAPADAAQVARELEVESVLTGTFLRIGDVIRVSAQLVGGHAAEHSMGRPLRSARATTCCDSRTRWRSTSSTG